MAQAAGNSGWLRGKVKAVLSGDTLVIMGFTKAEIPPEKTVVLAHLSAPRLARRGGQDDPFAWESREYLRKLCIGKDVVFRTEYTIPNFSREFCSVFIGTTNVGNEVVTHGWAKVKEAKGEVTPEHTELLRLEEQARQQGVGLWDRVSYCLLTQLIASYLVPRHMSPGSVEAAIRNLPPSAVGDPSNLDAMGLLATNKGKPMEAIVEQVRDGSSLRVYLLPGFQFVQVFVAGIQSPSMGRRTTQESTIVTEVPSDEPNGEANAESRGPLTSAQRVTASSTYNEVAADPYGREAKHFTEIRVRIVLEGVDKFSNLIGSVYYSDGESAKDLAMELIENGYAKYVEWSASMMEDEARRKLKAAELQAKKTKLRLWTNYVPPATNSKAISDNFTGKVVEVVSGDCIIVADDSLPFGSPAAERRVNLSSIRCPKLGNPRREEKPAPYAREAREFLRTRLIGRQVQVSMEYSRKVPLADGSAAPAGPADSRVMGFGSVFLLSQGKESEDVSAAPPTAVTQQPGVNVAELVIARGFGTVIRHRDFEERSNYYENLLAAETRATAGKKGIHSAKDPPVMHIMDLLTASAKKAKDFLPFLQRNRRMTAVVEYVLSGHRFKLFVPKETCSIAFSFSGVRCPGRDEPYSNEAISLMRRKIMQRDVEIEVETVDRTGTFLGSLWESKSNVAIILLEAGLARLQTFGADRIPDAHLLAQAEQSAKKQKLKARSLIWENYVEGEEVTNGAAPDRKQKEEFKAVVTEVLGGGKFYVQNVADQKVASIQQQLASLNLKEAPVLGAFNPKKGDIVVSAPRGVVQSTKDRFEVFYIDYGNQEAVTYTQLRPLDASVSSAPGLAQLCQLAYLKVPTLEEDYGQEAAMLLSESTLNGPKEFRAVIEERDTSGGKVKGQGTGTIILVTLIDEEADTSVNAMMLKVARLEKRRRWEPKDRQAVLDELEKHQTEARTKRLGMWEYGDIQSDDDENPLPAKKTGAAGKR
ncbi:RNA-induced silencing complex, nuclease component Tudor-SN [Cynara cardunculus var. scolymus]|uniref:Ribonuclease n=1 Tax=Cynara cardunculus var. scolymus TaxID=59895 RepID=A0A103YBM6_CYNCS|nr:RNA-induced silencing complex, nuclease component Tudor-SN [Cynara cardunculus var. scolymus]